MKVRQNNFIWLFAFADLAFLLLIAFSQISNKPLDQIDLPKVPKQEAEKSIAPKEFFKLYIKPAGEKKENQKPFQLSTKTSDDQEIKWVAMTDEELLHELNAISQTIKNGPVLWPHPDARSEDTLLAYNLIRMVWQDQEVSIAVKPKDNEKEQP